MAVFYRARGELVPASGGARDEVELKKLAQKDGYDSH